MDLNFDFNNLIAGFVLSVFGFAIMKSAKKNGKPLAFFIGIFLLVFPYFVSNPYLLWGLGITLVVIGYKI